MYSRVIEDGNNYLRKKYATVLLWIVSHLKSLNTNSFVCHTLCLPQITGELANFIVLFYLIPTTCSKSDVKSYRIVRYVIPFKMIIFCHEPVSQFFNNCYLLKCHANEIHACYIDVRCVTMFSTAFCTSYLTCFTYNGRLFLCPRSYLITSAGDKLCNSKFNVRMEIFNREHLLP